MNVFLAIVKVIAILGGLIIVSELYVKFRKRFNKPKIGVELLTNLLCRDDYVSINGKIHRFSHFAKGNETLIVLFPPTEENKAAGGELAFANQQGLGYVFYNPSMMINCDFIFGKYGLKWARNTAIANIAKDKIDKYGHE